MLSNYLYWLEYLTLIIAIFTLIWATFWGNLGNVTLSVFFLTAAVFLNLINRLSIERSRRRIILALKKLHRLGGEIQRQSK